ncbi:hypothetical protein [Acinetobacter bereziniae]|uniref:hypothetical protein n=1 Tax=Acinetobacter bereziniae TaxID=106648 RepID=UPI001250890A|nr:hypothetical protein [Acinetobacter bereziniae]
MDNSDDSIVIKKLTSIENQIKEIKAKDNISKLVDVNRFDSFFIGLSTISLLLIFLYYVNINDANDWARNYLFWGSIFGKVTLSILILNYIYRFEPIEYFYNLKFTKFISGLVFSAVILYSNSKASSLINDIFSVSSNNFPYSLTFTTVFYSINYIANILSIISLLLAITLTFLEISHSITNKEFTFDKDKWIIFVLFLFFLIILGLRFREFSESAIRYKAYQLALTMDFNEKYSCEGIPSGLSVAYIGSSQQKVIINTSNSTENIPLNFENFLMNSDKGYVSKSFIVKPCLNNQISFQEIK